MRVNDTILARKIPENFPFEGKIYTDLIRACLDVLIDNPSKSPLVKGRL